MNICSCSIWSFVVYKIEYFMNSLFNKELKSKYELIIRSGWIWWIYRIYIYENYQKQVKLKRILIVHHEQREGYILSL